MRIIRSLKRSKEPFHGLLRAVVFALPLLAMFLLDAQVINPLGERLYPLAYNTLANRGLNLDLSWFYSYLLVAVLSALALGALTLIGLRLYDLEPGDIGWRRAKHWPVRLLVGVAAGVLYVLVWGIARHLGAVVFFLRLPYFSIGPTVSWSQLTTAPAFNVFVGTWSLSAVFEELFYRGLAYAALKRRFGWKAALPLAALLFAWAHFPFLGDRAFDPFEFGGLACSGLLCTGLLEWDGTLLAPITAHLMINFLAYVVPIVFRMT